MSVKNVELIVFIWVGALNKNLYKNFIENIFLTFSSLKSTSLSTNVYCRKNEATY